MQNVNIQNVNMQNKLKSIFENIEIFFDSFNFILDNEIIFNVAKNTLTFLDDETSVDFYSLIEFKMQDLFNIENLKNQKKYIMIESFVEDFKKYNENDALNVFVKILTSVIDNGLKYSRFTIEELQSFVQLINVSLTVFNQRDLQHELEKNNITFEKLQELLDESIYLTTTIEFDIYQNKSQKGNITLQKLQALLDNEVLNKSVNEITSIKFDNIKKYVDSVKDVITEEENDDDIYIVKDRKGFKNNLQSLNIEKKDIDNQFVQEDFFNEKSLIDAKNDSDFDKNHQEKLLNKLQNSDNSKSI